MISLPTHTSLKIQKEPAVAEVEMGVVPVLVHQLKQLRVQNLFGRKSLRKAILSPPHTPPTLPPLSKSPPCCTAHVFVVAGGGCPDGAPDSSIWAGVLTRATGQTDVHSVKHTSPPQHLCPGRDQCMLTFCLLKAQALCPLKGLCSGQCLTWMRDLMFAKCVSMAPPWGKFWFIRFMSSEKQLKARASGQGGEEGGPQQSLPQPQSWPSCPQRAAVTRGY